MKLFTLSLLLALSAVFVAAQPRPVTPAPAATAKPTPTPDAEKKQDDKTAQPAPSPTPAPAPVSVKAKYEGGVFGYSKKQSGTLHFDEVNNRLVFRNKEGKELLSFPYDSLQVVYPDTKAVQPMAAAVVGALPLPYGANIPAWFVRKKVRYLTFQFAEPGAPGGLTSFKLENKETLFSVLTALCQKADLRAQGDSCYRPKTVNTRSATGSAPVPAPPTKP